MHIIHAYYESLDVVSILTTITALSAAYLKQCSLENLFLSKQNTVINLFIKNYHISLRLNFLLHNIHSSIYNLLESAKRSLRKCSPHSTFVLHLTNLSYSHYISLNSPQKSLSSSLISMCSHKTAYQISFQKSIIYFG